MYAPDYFDLSTFPDGETKRALLRVQKKRSELKNVDGGAFNGRNSPAVEKPTKKGRRKKGQTVEQMMSALSI